MHSKLGDQPYLMILGRNVIIPCPNVIAQSNLGSSACAHEGKPIHCPPKENKSNSLDNKKTVQADDKLDNNVVKTSVKSDDNQNTQIDSNRLLADNKDLEAQTK